MRIAIIEDNKALADGIAKSFKSEGHGVDQIHDGDDALSFLMGEKTDLIVLDVNLPGKSGLEILRSLRNAQNQTPVLLLTARDTINDKVDGLDLGADDYLTKPFELAELLAGSRALLRRASKEITAPTKIGNLEFDSTARQITISGEAMELPRREFALAEILIGRKGHVISKSQIMEHLYGVGADVEESTIELYIHRLRKKLEHSGTEIKTVRGLGYCFREVT